MTIREQEFLREYADLVEKYGLGLSCDEYACCPAGLASLPMAHPYVLDWLVAMRSGHASDLALYFP